MAHPDFESFIDALGSASVRYLIVGAHAVAFHARPRATKDLDVFVDPSMANMKRLRRALTAFFGGPPPSYAAPDRPARDEIIQLGVAPVRIDLMFDLPGVRSFRAAWAGRVTARFGKVPTQYISLDHLMAAKRAAGRKQDLADLEALGRTR